MALPQVALGLGPVVDRVINNLITAINLLQALPLLNGRIIQVTFTNVYTDTQVVHGLSRPVTGFVEITKQNGLGVYLGSGTHPDPRTSFYLQRSVGSSTTPFTTKVYVF